MTETTSLQDHPLTKIPILQRVFLFAARKLSTPIKLAGVTSTWDESLRVYGAGAIVWRKAYQEKPARVTGFLHDACIKGGVPWVVDHLCQAGVDPNNTDKAGYNSLHLIAKWSLLSKNAIECIDILLKHGAQIDAKGNPRKSAQMNGIRETPLHLAIQIGNAEAVDALLKAGANYKEIEMPHASDNILHLAVLCNSTETLAVLIKHLESKSSPAQVRSDFINKRGHDGKTPACLGASQPNFAPNFMELIFKYHADATIADNTGSYPFLEFVEWCATLGPYDPSYAALVTAKDNLEKWIELSGPQIINQTNQNTGRNALHNIFGGEGSAQEAYFLVEILVRYGIDVNALDNSGNTPLHVLMDKIFSDQDTAEEYCECLVKMMQTLFDCAGKQINWDIENADGQTVYAFASEYPRTQRPKWDGQVIGMWREEILTCLRKQQRWAQDD